MAPVVCFDALGTCFTLSAVIKQVDEQFGEQLRSAGFGAKGFVNDWFDSAQRDYTYLSLVNAPPPPIAKVLKTTLPLTLSTALGIPISSLPPPEPITSLLSSLEPAPKIHAAFEYLNRNGRKVVLVTNGAKETTLGYAKQAGVGDLIQQVLSCDEVGKAKPHKEVYEAANDVCERLEEGNKEDRWFVAAHLWDLAAARQAGFKTGFVAYDLPSISLKNEEELKNIYALYGKPDIVGSDLYEVVKQIA